MTVVAMKACPTIPGLDEVEFVKFQDDLAKQIQEMYTDFKAWNEVLTLLIVKLDKDPTANLAAFYEKLEYSQFTRNTAVDIIVKALAYRAAWDNNLYVAERYVRIVRSALGKDIDKKENKNKELQESVMYDIRPDVFECFHQCEATLAWLKTMIEAFNAKLDNLESANLNVNRQITVTELLAYKGLI